MLYKPNTGKMANLGLKVILCCKIPQAEVDNLNKEDVYF
jgi:hypothetical protein